MMLNDHRCEKSIKCSPQICIIFLKNEQQFIFFSYENGKKTTTDNFILNKIKFLVTRDEISAQCRRMDDGSKNVALFFHQEPFFIFSFDT